MDHSYPLKPYDSYRGHVQDFDDLQIVAHPSRTSHHFSIPRKPISNDPDTNIDYTALIDPSSGSDFPGTQSRTRHSRRSFIRWWLPEIFASILSIASLLSIVIVLRIYQGQSLNDLNLPKSLTLNGIVAAIATVNRVTLMVSVGSAMSQEAWLWFSPVNQRQKCRSRLGDLALSDAASRSAWGSLVFLFVARRRWLAYIGASITIISLAFSAFTQQLLAIAEFPITSRNANLLPGNIPRVEAWQYFSGNPAEFALQLPFALRASIYNGMLSDAIVPITASCPTGNCTWPVTPSLAICGQCSPSTYEIHCDNRFCNYTMPSGSVITLISPGSSEGPGFAVISGKGGRYNSSLYDKLYIANFDVVGAPYMSLAQGFSNQTTTASECAMWLCIQAYNVSTRSNHQAQTIIQTFSSINSTPESGDGLNNFTFPTLPVEMNAIPNTNYSVSTLGALGFHDTLATMFNGTANLDIESSSAQSDAVDAIWSASANLDPWIQQVALSMTNALRNSSEPTSLALYNGTGYQLGISVRWPWIALPAAMVLLSVIFLSMVIIQTARSPVASWKGSPLAILFFEVEQEIKQSVLGHTDRFKGIEDAVSETIVVLKGQPGGIWTFKAA